jgi:3-isopropylmalate dehydrogenase
MMLEWSLDLPQAGAAVRAAVERAIEDGHLTADLGGSESTVEVGAAVLSNLPAQLQAPVRL